MYIKNTDFSQHLREEIEYARRAHASIPDHLSHTDPLIRYTNFEILHQINPNPTLASRTMTGDQAEERWMMSDFHRYLLSGKLLASHIPPPDDLELSFRKRWLEGGDHYLLQEILASGRVPLAWSETWSAMRPRNLHEANTLARKRGYNVPDRFLADDASQNVSYSESEAFYAAYLLVSGNYHGWLQDVEREDVEYWRPLVCQLTCQFIIPDPLTQGKSPYIVDQLWIVSSYPDLKLRLMAVEIDGEIHLGEGEQESSKKRDAMLLAMGYEVYHLAGWWCRVDPFRTICRFLEASRLVSELTKSLRGGNLDSIDQYQCGLCGNPIVRREADWLYEIEIKESGLRYIAHGECAEYLSDYREIDIHYL